MAQLSRQCLNCGYATKKNLELYGTVERSRHVKTVLPGED